MLVRHIDQSQIALLAAAAQQQGAASDEDLLAMYHSVRELQEMFTAFCPGCVRRFAICSSVRRALG